jgi:putative membrane protein
VLWLKALHIIAMVTWFAGLFYLPRLFVYHADTADAPSLERFQLMERRLFGIMSIGGTAAVALGVAMVAAAPGYLRMGWLQVKIVLVALLVAYHFFCYKFMRSFANNRNERTSKFFRAFNELPSLLLVAIVILAVLKPF